MTTLGVSLNIDVSKIDKERLFKGEKGTYLSATVFIDTDKQDQYGNNGGITHSQSKEERERKDQHIYIGNAKVFYSDEKQAQHQQPPQPATQNQPDYSAQQGGGDYMDLDIPF